MTIFASVDYDLQRERMVARQIEARGVSNPRVLAAMRSVPRHRFVPAAYRDQAYEDRALPIGQRQTISQPYVVAVMTSAIDPRPADRVLEIGTGSGYQAAVLSKIVAQVFTIEIVPELAARARETLAELGYKNVTVIEGNGWAGLPEQAPFDAIVVTAAPDEVPPALIEQLRVGGRMVIPVGRLDQELQLLEKTEEGLETRRLFDVRFVPMTGKDEE